MYSLGDKIPDMGKVLRNKAEYNELMKDGEHDASRSYFSPSGGFVACHNDHNISGAIDTDREPQAAKVLADAGYRVYLDSEKSTIIGKRRRDGRLESWTMDIKTLNLTGTYRLAKDLYDADAQDAQVAIIYKNTKAATKGYVAEQINRYRNADKKVNNVLKHMILIEGNTFRWMDI